MTITNPTSVTSGHERSDSIAFADIQPEQASGILEDVIRYNQVYLGGGSIGPGLNKAACYYTKEHLSRAPLPEHFKLAGAADLLEDAELTPLEDSFYVVDIGCVVSQVYQWRKCFPRVEPFYAVKCNPDRVIVRTLALLGCNFDCASRNEIRLVQELSKDLPRQPEIIYANPCKSRAHLLEAVCKGIRMVTFDNVAEVQKCASISKKIQLVLRIITDDRGCQCRLSSKYGAPRTTWRTLLATAKQHGLQVVGVSFHVGSGCRDATLYELALKDAQEVFEMAKTEFGFDLHIIDIGGGFPGETHSVWNPELLDEKEGGNDSKEGTSISSASTDESEDDHFMYFNEIAEQVTSMIDKFFPPETGVRVIAEPGRFFVAACATLCCSVIGVRSNTTDDDLSPINDKEMALALDSMTRDEEKELVSDVSKTTMRRSDADVVLGPFVKELADYSRLFAQQNLALQESDVYNDTIDLFKSDFKTQSDVLGPPDETQLDAKTHTVEGMKQPLVSIDETEESNAMITLASAGEAAVKGVVLQTVADSKPLQDDYGYYINDGVYGAMNNLMFDHATIRPRVLRKNTKISAKRDKEGFQRLESNDELKDGELDDDNQMLYPSTVFGPTCDSIDVVARSVLLPKLKVGDWMYFQNMGAYTMAAASSFNGFTPTEKFYVSSQEPEYFEALVAGPNASKEKKKGTPCDASTEEKEGDLWNASMEEKKEAH